MIYDLEKIEGSEIRILNDGQHCYHLLPNRNYWYDDPVKAITFDGHQIVLHVADFSYNYIKLVKPKD